MLPAAEVASSVPGRAGAAAVSVLALLLCLPAACQTKKSGSPEPAAVASSVTVPDAVLVRFQVGNAYRYDLSLRSTLEVAAGAAPVELDLNATLELRPGEPGPVTSLAARLQEVNLLSSGAAKPEELEPLRRALAAPWLIDLNQPGRLAGVSSDSNGAALVGSIFRTIAAALQVQGGAGERWVVEELDAVGAHQVAYQKTARAGVLQKTKLSYGTNQLPLVGQSTPLKLTPQVKLSSIELTLSDAMLQGVKLSERLELQLGPDARSQSRTELALTLRERAKSTLPDIAALRRATVASVAGAFGRSDGAQGGDFDEQRRAGMTFEAALKELEAQANANSDLTGVRNGQAVDDSERHERELEAQARSQAFSAMVAILRTQPTSVEKALALIHSGSPAAFPLLDALASAGGATAQKGMAKVALEPKLRFGLRKRATFALSRVPGAEPGTIDALARLVDDDRLGRQALFGLGTLTRRLAEAQKPELSERAAAVVVARLKAAKSSSERLRALRAVANSGYTPALDLVRPLLTDKDESVRGAAVEAIRLMHHDDVDALIARALVPAETRAVRLAALNALEVREPSASLAAALGSIAQTAPDPDSRSKAVQIIPRWLSRRPELKQALQHIAQAEERPAIRQAAQSALGS